MPPRPRGRASTRARGTGRGGGTVGSAAAGTGEASSDATPPDAAPIISTEAESQSVAPKQEEAEDAKPVLTGQNDATATQSQDSPAPVATMVAPTPSTTEATPRAPVARIGSLQGSVPPSRSASPATRGRGSATRGKRGPIKPAFTGRRSKEDRDAIEKQQKEREKLRNAERIAADAKRKKEEDKAHKREAKRLANARGGYGGVVSGPFSMGSSREDRKNNSNRGLSGFGSGSGSRAVRVKNEDMASYSGGGGGSSSGGRSGGGGPSIKREDGGYVSSSEEEEDKEFPRKDIDTIEISSDENEDDQVAPAQRHRSTLPVRIGRKEHQERAFGINTDASTETSAKTLERSEATGQTLAKAASEQTSRKGKGKAKDVEITGERKPFRGVWQDPEDTNIAIKTESISDDENMQDAQQVESGSTHDAVTEKQEPPSPEADRKPKIKPKHITEPVLQTDEDRAEWARFQTNLQHIRAELGPEEPAPVDASGDSTMADASSDAPTSATKKPTVRDNNVYLFQLPPLMPELLHPSIKKEEQPADAQPQPAASTPTPTPASTATNPKIKLEEGGFSNPSQLTSHTPLFPPGFVGKLRVHQSGKTTLDWGGTSYELTPGQKANFLQEVVSINVVPEKDRVVPEDSGDAVSFGRVKGKFVVVPDWGEMLGV